MSRANTHQFPPAYLDIPFYFSTVTGDILCHMHAFFPPGIWQSIKTENQQSNIVVTLIRTSLASIIKSKTQANKTDKTENPYKNVIA